MLEKIKNTLSELAFVLQELNANKYNEPCLLLSKGTIGQHCRHIIEFFNCMLDGYEIGEISYDNRKRYYNLESDVKLAVLSIAQIIIEIYKADKKLLSSYLIDEKDILVETSYNRELAFNLEHCIHHQAFIRIAIENLTDMKLPQNFGVSPSTVYYREKLCAQ
jgi:hypothetical protein